jgi:hypothetical protein
MPAKEVAEKDVDEVSSQRKRPDAGRFLLQVDRQAKGSYQSLEAAQAAALIIKKGHPVVQVSVYDKVESSNTIVELPTA